jgi:hypothetical protein
MVDIPMNTESMVSGLGYVNPQEPTTDSMPTTESGPILGTPNPQPSPMSVVSLATKSEDAPGNAQTWNSGDKGTDWMGGSTLPWQK